jgi:hypothetical protein
MAVRMNGPGDVESFDEGGKDVGGPRRGRLEPVEVALASGSEGGSKSLTARRLYALTLAVTAIANDSAAVGVGDAEVDTGVDVTGETSAAAPYGSAPVVLDLGPGQDRETSWPLDGRRGSLLAAGRAIVGSSGLELSPEGGLGGSGLGLGRLKRVPDPDEPEQVDEEHKQ